MFRKQRINNLLAALIILLWILGACSSTPEVSDIKVEPDTTILTGETASLTINASGSGLQFSWEPSRGSLSSVDAPSVLYTAPDSPGLDIVTVTVTDKDGKQEVRTITIQAIEPTSKPAPTATSMPTPTYTPTKRPPKPSDTPMSTYPPTLSETPPLEESSSPLITITPTPTLTIKTLEAEFVKDVTIPDGTVMEPNQRFTKTWRYRNDGYVPWGEGVQLVFVPGTLQGYESNNMGGPDSVDVRNVAPDENVDVRVQLVAPATPGTYRSYWRLQLPSGEWLENNHYAEIVVKLPATPTRSPGSFQDFERCDLASCAEGVFYATPQLCTSGGGPSLCINAEKACPKDEFRVQEGKQSLCVKTYADGKDTGGTVRIFHSPGGPIDLCFAKTLSIMVYDTHGSNTVELRLQDNKGHRSNRIWSDSPESKDYQLTNNCLWTKITWDLSQFKRDDQYQCQVEDEHGVLLVDLRQIKAIEIYEWNNGIYCFDNVRYE